MKHVQDKTMRSTVRRNLVNELGSCGLLEYHCPTPACAVQVFATWEVDLTCNRCGQRVASAYHLEKNWLK